MKREKMFRYTRRMDFILPSGVHRRRTIQTEDGSGFQDMSAVIGFDFLKWE